MKTLIIYDSLYGNTEKIARAIGSAFDGARVIKVNEASTSELNQYELIIFGSPTHGGRPSQNMQKFFNQISSDGLKNIKTAAFDTGDPPEGEGWFVRMVISFFGYASKRLARILESKGANVLAAETFFVTGKEGPLKDGEEERAKKWGEEVKNKLR